MGNSLGTQKVPIASTMNSTQWLLIDTETSGLRNPVYCVEIAAQMMKGLEPSGPAFHALLNHDVDIDPAAEALHGYSRQFLRGNGINPVEAHEKFRCYAGNLPIVSFNLSFDLGRVLEPESARLSIPAAGSPGFCALTLARRCLFEADSHRLDFLCSMYLPDEPAPRHRAVDDVKVTLRLFREVIWPRLERAGLVRFEEIAEFSRTTPVACCVERIRGAALVSQKKGRCPASLVSTDAASELFGLLRGILADNKLVDAELWTLRHWLDSHLECQSDAVKRIRELTNNALADGLVTPRELRLLKEAYVEFVK